MGSFRLTPRILLWALPTAVLSLPSIFASPGTSRPSGPGAGFTPLQTILFIWIYASICEEVLTRGLLQSYLSIGGRGVSEASSGFRLSMPVVTSGIFFGAMHVVLIPLMGPAAIPLIVLTAGLGLVAAHYRERTGSLAPAIIIHALFNIGGTVPAWVGQWIRGG
jgi:membrane protease YdiL (CAAX protease family)